MRRYAKMWAFAGMGFIISVGYMDPGNWATDITAGSSSGYVLLVAVLLASFTAMFLQVRARVMHVLLCFCCFTHGDPAKRT